MMTCEIPQDRWESFLDDFSRRHQGDLVSIEVTGGELGSHAIATGLPLVGITADPKSSDGARIEVMAGDSPDRQMNHDIRRPSCLRVAMNDDANHDVAVEIESASMPKTIIHFGGMEGSSYRGAMPA